MQENKDLKKIFSRIGLGYFLFLIVAEGIAFLMPKIPFISNLEQSDNSWITYTLHMVPLWAIGFPICLLIVWSLPKETPDQNELKLTSFIKFYLAMTFIMIVFNLVGTGISWGIGALAGKKLANTTIDMIMGQEFFPTLVFAVILGPIMEELAFRKVLLDRTVKYSKKYSIILSGVMFGLFHLNLYQFFYAAALGCVLAYIYINTGKVRYTICFHSLINFIHGALPLTFIKKLDLDSIKDLSPGMDPSDPETIEKILAIYSNPAFVAYMLYAMIIFAFFIVGIVMVITQRKKLHVDDTMSPLQKPGAVSTIYLNIGMILFLLGTIGFSIYGIIEQLI